MFTNVHKEEMKEVGNPNRDLELGARSNSEGMKVVGSRKRDVGLGTRSSSEGQARTDSNLRKRKESILGQIISHIQQLHVSTSVVDENGIQSDHIVICFGTTHGAILLFLQNCNENGEKSLKMYQCVKECEEVLQFLTVNKNEMMSDGNISPVCVKLILSSVGGVRNYVDMNEAVEPVTGIAKPALISAAEVQDYNLCSSLIEQNIPMNIYLHWHFGNKILALLCLSRSLNLVTQYLQSCPIPLDFSEALLLAYEKQKVDCFEFILSIGSTAADIKVKDFSLVISKAVENLDVPFLKYLHEKGVDAGKLVYAVAVNNVSNFLYACFALKFPSDSIFPIERKTALTVFVPACIEAIIRQSKSPLTCVNALLKTTPSDPENKHPVPNLQYLLTEIMHDANADASIVKVLMQLWHAAKFASERVEEEQEDLKSFCIKIEQIVLGVFACDNTNMDVNLIPLVKMQHDRARQQPSKQSTKGNDSAKEADLSSTKEIYWIFGIHSIIRQGIDRNFKVLFAVPQINRLIAHIFHSAVTDFRQMCFKERFYPMILFYVQMAMRTVGFLLLTRIVIVDYGYKGNNKFSFSKQTTNFIPLSQLEIFLAIFILSEILEELGGLYEIQEGVDNNMKLHTFDKLKGDQAGDKSVFKEGKMFSADDSEYGSVLVDEDAPSIRPMRTMYGSLSPQFALKSKDQEKFYFDEAGSGKASTESNMNRSPSQHLSPFGSNTLKRTRGVSAGVTADSVISPSSDVDTISDSQKQEHNIRNNAIKRRKRNLAIIREFFNDEWNFLDVINSCMGILWLAFRCIPGQCAHARITLSLMAIPWSLRLLRFLSINKTLGELVIIIKAMLHDVMAFLIVYVLMIIGFSVAFRGLFTDLSSFHSNGQTFLSLFAGTMSNFTFEDISSENGGLDTIGIVLTILFVVMTAILLMNLLIARMSNSFQRISDNSQMEWAFDRARVVMSLTLIHEKPVWNSLPAPLNLIPIALNAFGMCDFVARRFAKLSGESTAISVRGTVANIVLYLVCFPFLRTIELYVAFAQTFLWASEESMSAPKFFWLLLQILLKVLLYIPFFFVQLLSSCCMSRDRPSQWISRVNLKDGCIVLPEDDCNYPPPEMAKNVYSKSNLLRSSPSFLLGKQSLVKSGNRNPLTLSMSDVYDTVAVDARQDKSIKKPTSLFRGMPYFASIPSTAPVDCHAQFSCIFGLQDIELILKPLIHHTTPLPKEENLEQFIRLHNDLKLLRQENQDIKGVLTVIAAELQKRSKRLRPSHSAVEEPPTKKTTRSSDKGAVDSNAKCDVSTPGDSASVKKARLLSTISPMTRLTGVLVDDVVPARDDLEGGPTARPSMTSKRLTHRPPPHSLRRGVSLETGINPVHSFASHSPDGGRVETKNTRAATDSFPTFSVSDADARSSSSSHSQHTNTIWWDPLLNIASNFSINKTSSTEHFNHDTNVDHT